MKTRRILFAALLLLGTSLSSYAQTLQANYITTAVPFLSNIPDARGASLGFSGVATSPDAFSMFYNPAKYAFMSNDHTMIASGFNAYTTFPNQYLLYDAFAQRIGNSVIAATARYHRCGDIELYDAYHQSLGYYRPQEFAVDVACSYRFGDYLSIGAAARFVHSNARIVQVFDSCEICWPEYLDSADYALRRPIKVQSMLKAGTDKYRERALLAYIKEVKKRKKVFEGISAMLESNADDSEKGSDSAAVSSAKVAAVSENSVDSATAVDSLVRPKFKVDETSLDWKKFREEYVEWMRGIPMEARDTNKVYVKVRKLVNAGVLPESFVDEFNIMEAARAKNYRLAAEYVANFYEKYEVAAMDEFFLRNAILIAFLAHNPTLADVLYKEAIKPHEEFAPIEKLLIQKEIPRIRRR